MVACQERILSAGVYARLRGEPGPQASSGATGAAPPTIRQMICRSPLECLVGRSGEHLPPRRRGLPAVSARMTMEAMKPPRRAHTTISLFGNFGTHNLGNEYTLQAIIHNVHKYLPHAKVNCICTSPREVTASHQVPAFPISDRLVKAPAGEERRGGNGALAELIPPLPVPLPR